MNSVVPAHFISQPRPQAAPAPSSSPWVGQQAPRLSRLLVVAGCVLALAACSDKKPQSASSAPPEVGVLTLQPERQLVTNELPGRTSAFLTAEIRPQVGGILQKRLFTEGATVKSGQVLYQLDPSTYSVALKSAEAAQAKARATLASAQTNARRNAELVKIDAVSRQVYDDSQAAVLQAQSDVAVAAAAVDAARINLGYTQIKSPISGRTTTSSVTPGALVTANQTAALTTVSQIDPLYVDFTQSSADVLQLKNAMAAGRIQSTGKGEARITIKLDDGSDYAHEGRLQFSGVNVNPNTGSITLRAVVPNPDGLLMPGMYVRATLESGVQEKALLAPQQAVSRDPAGNASVMLVGAQNKLERRRIVTGAAVGNRWEVVSGLAAGDTILVDGSLHAKDGDRITPVPWTPRDENKAVPGDDASTAAPAPAQAASAPASR